MPASSRTAKPRKLTEFEWNFWQKCPADELEECKVYKAARRSQLWKTIFNVLRKASRLDNFRADRQWERIFFLLRLCPEFPETPWLGIGSTNRRRRLARLRNATKWKPGPKAREKWGWNHSLIVSDTFPKAFPTGEPDGDERDRGPFWNDGAEILSRYRRRHVNNAGREFHIRITWDHSDAEILKVFKLWLRGHRPPEFTAYGKRGRPLLDHDKLRADLRRLGAWSLSRRLNSATDRTLTQESAIKGYSDSESKEPLYPSAVKLSKAQTQSLRIIKALEPTEALTTRTLIEFEWIADRPMKHDPSGIYGGIEVSVTDGKLLSFRMEKGKRATA